MSDGQGSGTEAAIGISYSVQVGDGRNIVLQTHMPQHVDIEELHKVADKLRLLADRQVEFGKVEAINHELDLKDRIIKQLEDGIDAVDRKVESLQRSGAVTAGGGGLHQRNAKKVEVEKESQQRANAVLSLQHEKKTREELVQKRTDLLTSLG